MNLFKVCYLGVGLLVVSVAAANGDEMPVQWRTTSVPGDAHQEPKDPEGKVRHIVLPVHPDLGKPANVGKIVVPRKTVDDEKETSIEGQSGIRTLASKLRDRVSDGILWMCDHPTVIWLTLIGLFLLRKAARREPI